MLLPLFKTCAGEWNPARPRDIGGRGTRPRTESGSGYNENNRFANPSCGNQDAVPCRSPGFMSAFRLHSEFAPAGDQPQAIAELTAGLRRGLRHQVLLGVTGSGKTFTMANLIAQVDRPALVIAHNKTLAAQLCAEFREFFPENAVEYFVSFYDYYQPEAYLPQTDTYIAKDASINDEIDRLRHSATQAISQRRDVIVVASVSCIYGLGAPEVYREQSLRLRCGESYERRDLLAKLVNMQFRRNDLNLTRGTFRVRGDVVEVYPVNEEVLTRLDFFGDELDQVVLIDPLTGEVLQERDEVVFFPATHYVAEEERLERALKNIEQELKERLQWFARRGKLLEYQRLEQRTNYDLEMLREIGYCTGIENYSRHLDGRKPGEPPWTLLDYFPQDYLLIIDESHQTIPQLNAMYAGDRSRKDALVAHGFRLPSAYDNRPLTFEEFEQRMGQTIYTSATPGPYELAHADKVVEQIIRPTGLVDPVVEVRPTNHQIDDLLNEIRRVTARHQRVLVTTLTKRMAEDLTEYLVDLDLKVQYLHADVQTLERQEILRDLRLGEYDVLVGINLLREGLDLPEVTLVAILDADKEGFLRSETSLIQTIGRAARHVDGRVLLYADTVTGSMRRALEETNRRRRLQEAYNREQGIAPESIQKAVRQIIESKETSRAKAALLEREEALLEEEKDLTAAILRLEKEMNEAAKALEFERAAELRDELRSLQKRLEEGG